MEKSITLKIEDVQFIVNTFTVVIEDIATDMQKVEKNGIAYNALDDIGCKTEELRERFRGILNQDERVERVTINID